jgi:hypothetical protein
MNMSNQIAEQLSHAFSLQSPLFEEAAQMSTMIGKGEKEHHFKMHMLPCGTGLDDMTSRHIHEFTQRTERSLQISSLFPVQDVAD